MTEIPAALRKLGIRTVSDDLEPGQRIDPNKAASSIRIFFQQELMEFLERYQERQEGNPCQVSDENIGGNHPADAS